MATLSGYPELARSCGLDPARLMAEVGLDIADLATPDTWVLAAPVAQLLELSARECGRQDFGLSLTEARRLGTLGPLAVVLREEPDLRGGMELLERYAHNYNEALHLHATEGDGLVTVHEWLEFGEPAPVRQALELATGALVGIIRMLIADDWTPRTVFFAHPAPDDVSTHRRLLGPRLEFGSAFTGVAFPARELDTPIRLSDPSLRPYAHQFLQSFPPRRTASLVDEVGAAVASLLPQGQCTMANVGRALGLDERTLRRRLNQQGENFSSIVHATRARLAERYLTESLSLTHISQLLGFGAPSAFTRWFRQQFGTSPSDWRATVRLAPQSPGRS